MWRVTPPSKVEVRRARRAARREVAARRDLAADGIRLAQVAAGADTGLLDAVPPGGTVTLYESHTVEPATGPLLAALQARGLRVLLPITLPDLDLDWFDAADPERTPLGLDAVGEVALALVPGLSVDADGVRIGQGGGCYDKALPRMPRAPPRVVLLHPEEVLPAGAVPAQAHDQRVDAALTADGLVRLGSAGGRGQGQGLDGGLLDR